MTKAMHVGSGSGNRTVKIWLCTSSVNKLCRGFVGTSGGNKQFTETETVSLSNLDVTSTGGGSQSATYTLEADGDIISLTTSFGSIDQGDWISPKSAAPGDYEVRATVVSGSLSSGTTGSWLALTSNRSWTVSRASAGASDCVLTIEIRKGSGATLASATIGLSTEVL